MNFDNLDPNPFYYIPALERVFMARGTEDTLCQEYREVNGMGVLVKYDDGKEVDTGKIAKWLKEKPKVRGWTYCLIKAASPEAAIRKFFKIYPGARIGERSRALIINRRKKIIELPYCSLIHIGKKTGRFMCGPPVETDNENYDRCMFGDCVLNIADYPDESCPLKDLGVNSYFFPQEFPQIKPTEIVVDGKKYLFISLNKK